MMAVQLFARCWNYIRDNRFTFILRGVHLLGIDSVNVGMDKRKIVWQRLATDLDITRKSCVSRDYFRRTSPVFEALQAG